MSVPLTEEDLHDLYVWVDEIPISRPKRNITRDFSDGCCVAEVMKFFFPKLVDLHNYTPAMSQRKKMENWETLNNRVFKKLHFEVPKDEVNDITSGVPGAIERFLRALRTKIGEIKARREACIEDVTHRQRGEDEAIRNYRTHNATSMYDCILNDGQENKEPRNRKAITNNNNTGGQMNEHVHTKNAKTNSAATIRLLLEEKDRTILELRETVSLLNDKIAKMEELIRIKDEKINAYREQHGRRKV
ncbi:hypothetical protein TRVL_03704 [Trypanosoma vivax]|uniref:Calponin-homology (CH) domain-containing protein n=1 Tax=Trypanosoma vivax (strain Y486) TaxID=1055687 RepID=G0TUJ9_TRYVY|nr:hypothetical protein TRVL_03704 [Trypanosoma vivax]CCC47633.1 conserved hypothetical protein [Trypanosoma vivax Y486]